MLAYEHRAAQYVRMSTDMQRYSIENQAEVISLYAACRGLTVVRSYEDAGRSGVRIEGRSGLQTLLSDVASGQADFSVVLVYDVSRWGRFQDSDESAHYEYLCTRAGVRVEYCAEQFSNDGSLTAAVLKNIKRAMAGEFSRELSIKVFAGQSRLASKGYHVGATAGYGLRRILIDEYGSTKMELAFGQRKSLQSERVVLAPGPPSELRTIQRVYDLFIDHNQAPAEIAITLNREGVAAEFDRPWTRLAVLGVLSNEKYIGNAIYNRTSKKLNGKWQRNPPSQWIRCDNAYEAIVQKERFEQARRRLNELSRPRTKADLLDLLTALWCRCGKLSSILVDTDPITPCCAVYAREFGSIAKAFRSIGFRHKENVGKNHDIRKYVIAEMTSEIELRGGTVGVSPWHAYVVVNDELKVLIFVSRLKKKGPKIWQFGYRSLTKPDIVIGVRLAERGGPILDYFILPFLFLPHGSWITSSMSSGLRLERFRSATLQPLYDLCARSILESPKW
jgi:DNA invertase Pin-like site-specific DNA recombinase